MNRKEHLRTVTKYGRFNLNDIIYEVEGLQCAKVRIYEGIFEDGLLVENFATGEKYGAVRLDLSKLDDSRCEKLRPSTFEGCGGDGMNREDIEDACALIEKFKDNPSMVRAIVTTVWWDAFVAGGAAQAEEMLRLHKLELRATKLVEEGE